MPNDLLGEIHSSTATTSPDWATFRGEVTGMYLLSGQGGEWDSQHLIREYNRNINSLYKSWTPTEPNATGLFIEPYNAGFSYQGTGDFRNYKWDTYSVSFDGVDDYIDLGNSSTLNPANITVSMWIKPHVLTSWDYLFTRGTADYVEAYRFEVGATQLIAVFGDGTTNGYIERAHGMVNDQWYHIAMTYDGATAALYVDGAQLGATASISIVMEQDSDTTTIGQPLAGAGSYFDGEIDEVAMWDSALSAAQILAIYNGGTPESLSPYSPVSWWRMGDGPLDNGSDKIIGDQMNLTLGSELITNGNFASDTDWTKAAGWSISGGVASCDGTQASFTSLTQDDVHTINKACVLEFDIVSTNGAELKYWVNGLQVIVTGATSTGHKKYTFFTNYGGKAFFEAASDFVGSITNVSVKDYNGNQGGMKNMTASDIVADTP